jgi:hypothetical protein
MIKGLHTFLYVNQSSDLVFHSSLVSSAIYEYVPVDSTVCLHCLANAFQMSSSNAAYPLL